MPDEPRTTAVVLATVGILVGLSALTSRASGRLGVPVALVFLAVGFVAGTLGFGLHFEDYGLTFRLGTLALVIILFDGGLNTPAAVLKSGLKPAAVLATLGVVVTGVVVAVIAWALGVDRAHAALIGAIVSSTDAAAVFSVLRGSGIQIRRRVGITLELESGLNDPMAVILTVECTRVIVTGKVLGGHEWLLLTVDVVREIGFGLAGGFAIGFLARILLRRVRLAAGGLFPVVTLALALVAYSLPTLVDGSGFIAVYIVAVMIGNEDLPFRAGIVRVHDAAAWVAQVGMFLLLGLLVTPEKLVAVAVPGLVLGLALAFLARPIAVAVSLGAFRYPLRELSYIAWVGLRGAVPIILATFPVMAGASYAETTFHLVFFIVIVNAVIPGSTVRFVTTKLGLTSHEPPPPPAILEMTSMTKLNGRVLAFFVDKASAASGVAIKDLPFPPGSSVMVIVRESALVAPRGDVVLAPQDHLYVVTTPEDEPLVRLMFGQQEEMG